MSIASMSVRQMRRHWDALARQDPLWAVLTDPEKKENRWRLDEFFETGRREVAALMEHLSGMELGLRRGRALDFGCGVGRLTQALADHFDQVVGVDISPAMVERAEALNRRGDRCNYRVNSSDDLSGHEDGSFDFVCSLITLQHIEPVFTLRYLREFVRVLAPGGILVFQLPVGRVSGEVAGCRAEGGSRGLRRRMSGLYYSGVERWQRLRLALRFRRSLRQGSAVIQMHGMPRAEVEAVLRDAGAQVAQVAEDDSAGPVWRSCRYYAVKGRKPA